MSVVFDLIRFRFLELVHRDLPHSTRYPLVIPPLQQVASSKSVQTSSRTCQVCKHFLQVAGQEVRRMSFVKRHFLVSSRVGCAQVLLDTISCCVDTKQVDPAFRRSVVDEQESEQVQSSFLSSLVQIPSFPSERARCAQVHPIGIRRVFDFGFDQAPGYGDALVFANTRSLRPS